MKANLTVEYHEQTGNLLITAPIANLATAITPYGNSPASDVVTILRELLQAERKAIDDLNAKELATL